MSPEVPTRVLAVNEGAVFEACSSAPEREDQWSTRAIDDAASPAG